MNLKTTGAILATTLAIVAGPVSAATLEVSLADPGWTGNKIPEGQHCQKFGGNGATPELKISGIPADTVAILVEFNDASFLPLSSGGGHGIVGFEHIGGAEAILPPVPGGTDETPAGTWIEKKNRATGAWESPGYLPPCSGGIGNRYFAVVKAVSADKTVLAATEITLGRY
ncbi:MAG: hypothetical protein OXF33_00100 [Rhodospirillales bacterium]|nr:hypothetical protein [Rhodospirillales bacterium]